MTLIPMQINFRGLAHSETIEADIHERIAWLEQFYGGIVRCRVLVEIPHRHRHDGRHFQVRIDITVPGGAPIVVSHEPSLHGPLKDVAEAEHSKDTEIEAVHRYAHVAIHEAFDVARRQLQDFAREQRGVVKTHEVEDVVMTTTQTDSAPLEEPLAELERQLISEFVSAAGQDLHALLMRHDEAATKLLTEASLYASARLTEVESRSHYLRKLHGEP